MYGKERDGAFKKIFFEGPVEESLDSVCFYMISIASP